VVARYDKLHLFDVDVADNRGRYRESDDYAYGSGVVVADTPVGRVGLTVCYDLRFPELYSELRAAGAELITAPSAFTAVTGAAHWDVLIRARAIETQCYVLAAAQGGTIRGREKPSGMRPSSTHGGACWRNRIKARRCCWPNATATNRRPSGRGCRCPVTGAFLAGRTATCIRHEFKA
jgi:predicted amidohydrolase